MEKMFGPAGDCPYLPGKKIDSPACRQCEYFHSPGPYRSTFIVCKYRGLHPVPPAKRKPGRPRKGEKRPK